MKIGIFGGTFDPVHFGHLRAAQECAQIFSLDTVLFVPTSITSRKQVKAASPSSRFDMLALALEGYEKFALSDEEIKRGGLSYSYDTIVSLKEKYPAEELYFIVGADAFRGIKNWKRGNEIFNIVDFIVVGRKGALSGEKKLVKLSGFLPDKIKKDAVLDYSGGGITIGRKRRVNFVETTRLDISSSAIRNNFKSNVSNCFLLPNEVINYIINNGLYA